MTTGQYKIVTFFSAHEHQSFIQKIESINSKEFSYPVISKILKNPPFLNILDKHLPLFLDAQLIIISSSLYFSHSSLFSKFMEEKQKKEAQEDGNKNGIGTDIIFCFLNEHLSLHLSHDKENYFSSHHIRFHLFPLEKESIYSMIHQTTLSFINSKYETTTNVSQKKSDLFDIIEQNQQIHQKMQQHLQKIKYLHEKIIPQRVASIRGLSLHSKFSAGEQSGGEFFDILMLNRKLLIFLSSCHNYLLSSLILKQVGYLKKIKEFEIPDIQLFLQQLYHEMIKTFHHPPTLPPLQLFVGLVDTKTLTIEGLNFGLATAFSTEQQSIPTNDYSIHESFHQKAYFHLQLQRGEKIIFLSPGITHNSQGLIHNRPTVNFLQNFLPGPPQETLNELFLQLKKRSPQSFLSHDASAIILEVGQNVLLRTSPSSR
jgi:hypothetical protein